MLTQKAIEAAKPGNKRKRIFDRDGLYLEISPTNRRWWRFKYFFDHHDRRISLGTYPEISLREAREKRDELRKLVARHIDPGAQRRAEREAKSGSPTNTFEAIAREWHGQRSRIWSAEHAERILSRLKKAVFPYIGPIQIAEVTAPQLLEAFLKITARGRIETAHRARADCSQVFRFAIASGRATDDPTFHLRGALPPVKTRHFAAITEPRDVGALMRAIRHYRGEPTTAAALQVLPLVMTRPGELRLACWSEFDLDEAVWRIPAERMKMRREHLVPLSRQAVAILRELQKLTGSHAESSGGGKNYVYPGLRSRDRPISENTLNAALRRLGFSQHEMTSHGFRAMASTLLHEQGWNSDAIERQLAHAPADRTKAAYHRGEHLAERRKMVQAWADYLDKLASLKPQRPPRRSASSRVERLDQTVSILGR